MSAHVTILCGPARSGKTERLLACYRQSLRQGPAGSGLWLAPNWRVAAEVRDRLLDGTLAGCFAPGVMTFGQFAQSVLRSARVPIRAVNPLMKRELVRQLLAAQSSAGRLRHFQSIARTPGLVGLVCEFIGELKRLEIWPEEFRRACEKRGGLADKDRELADLYEGYQQTLREHRLFDAEGQFWSARDLLHRAHNGKESGEDQSEDAAVLAARFPRLIVADGFTDFTRTQHEILDVLAARAEQMFVSLPLEAEPRRADLFAKPLATLSRLQRRHAGATVEQLGRSPIAEWPAMGHLERRLFENPRKRRREEEKEGSERKTEATDEAPLASQLPRIEILAAAKQIGEIEMVARRIKRLLVEDHVRPGDIAVVFRSSQQVGELVQEVFGRLGIPATFESGRPLDRSPAVRALATLLQLDLDDWPFDRLLAVLGSNYFQPQWPEWDAEAAATTERVIRHLQIPRGRERLMGELALDRQKVEESDDNALTDRCSILDDNRGVALAIAKHLSAALDALPQRATLPEWAAAWTRLADQTGLLRAMDDSQSSGLPLLTSSALSDRRSWNRLMESLTERDRLAVWRRQRPPELDRREALDALLDVASSDRLGHGGDESGHVRVLGAENVRSLRIPYLFLAGLSEKVFPPPDREDRLYSEAESARLIEAGLPLVASTERTREEMLLFYEALTRATERLWLSYPALDESAQPLLPSPFLTEVEQAFGPGQIPRFEQTDLSPVPRNVAGTLRVPDGPATKSANGNAALPVRQECVDSNDAGDDHEPLCDSEFRVRAVATAMAGNVSLLAGLFALSPLPSALAAGLELVYLRQDRERFGSAEGILQGELAQQRLATRFSVQHTFAATELERYASCPFRFYLERVLKIEPVEDLRLEFDVLERGRIVHDALSTFHRRVNERFGRPASALELDAAEFDALLKTAITESLPPEPTNPLQAAMREINHRLLGEWLRKYREQLEAYDAQWKDLDSPLVPGLLEVSFGRAGETAPSTERPFEIPLLEAASDGPEGNGDGRTVRISGRIDRVDIGTVAGRRVFNILDYKTGGPITVTPETVRAGTTLQLPIYALATMELLLADQDALPWRAGYWHLRDGGFKPRKALRMYSRVDGRVELEADWEDIRDSLADTVLGLAAGIRAGRFPVCSTDEYCTGHCPYSTVCRINQVRSLEKTCPPGTMRAAPAEPPEK
ncbi:MAG: exodeoxyribonuclease V subunit gamma [Planctomycetaceae bacterium]|nr:exodeoxyribonuclease V subunit gamma [Planctomycetaceae bacterium]